MATNTKPTTSTDKPKKTPPTLVERTKAQLSTATLKAKVTIDDLTALETHIAKLKALLA